MRFSGTVLQDGKVILTGVVGALNLQPLDWSGHFTVPQGQFIEVGEVCRLVLDDGRSGEFVIDEIPQGSHQTPVVYFSGSGPLQ